MTEDLGDVIRAVVLDVARQRNPALSAAETAHALGSDLGFDSLDLAQVAAELEVRLGLDPFARGSSSRILTVGDLIALYEAAR
jgi:acyl carrier protein